MSCSRRAGLGYRVFADVRLIDDCISRIRDRFALLLSQGSQSACLPARTLAAGQYLDQFQFVQRGLFGTAAALLVFSRSAPDPDRLRVIDELVRYLLERPEIEQSLVDASELPVVRARLGIEVRDTFKTADVLYALSTAPPAATGRDRLIGRLLSRVAVARRPDGGWGVELDSNRERDPLATAHVVRALHAAGVAVPEQEIEALRVDADHGTRISPYVRSAILLTLAKVTPEDRKLTAAWGRLWEELRTETATRAEANYEYTIGDRPYYVRIPWQLYLLGAASAIRRRAVLFSPGVRRILFDCINAVLSTEGFSYRPSGHAQSTRTNSIVVDTLWMTRQNLSRSPALSAFCLAVNAAARVVQSRIVSTLLVVAGVTFAAMATVAWFNGEQNLISSLGPELIGAALLTIAGASLRRIRN